MYNLSSQYSNILSYTPMFKDPPEKTMLIHADTIWAMVNTHYMVDGHPIHNKDPYNG